MSDLVRRVLVVLLVLSVPAAASGQTPWQTGIMAGTVLHREPPSTAGLDASVIVRRQQTPLVEVIAAVGALWFPETRTDFRAYNPPTAPSSRRSRRPKRPAPMYRCMPAAASAEARPTCSSWRAPAWV